MNSTPEFFDAPERASAATALAAAFRDAFGTDPAGVWSAPGRVNLVGEHVDYTGGLCLPLALPHRTFVALNPRADGVVRVRSRQEAAGEVVVTLADVGAGSPDGWAAYVAGVPWAMGRKGFDGDLLTEGFDALVDGHVPYGSGLSSSAALECAVAVALGDLLGAPLDDAGRAALAGACVLAENVVAGANTGGMDQAASLRCHEGGAILLDTRDDTVSQVALDLAGAGLALLVVDTRAEHSHAGGEYGQRRADVERAAEILGVPTLREVDPADLDAALERVGSAPDGDVLRRRVRHAVTEIDRVARTAELLRAGRAGDVGGLLDASHDSLRDDYEVSCRELDLTVDVARAHGALGARMTGGGFGGSAIALVAADRVGAVADAVAAAFAEQDLRAPRFLAALPSEGAGRDL
ncbi:galactokinase [Kineococcus radiotolerans]|uniref:Galactokinase n=1 Tax=Kineococcus radiotolerans TaxID=131568 RepID=A0A7W4XYA3_KINRA|nr:galactokinase [Kineococcus radiotolerans]MBB2902312.1 galactokinase [Kineococcus radiotolerans]